MATTATATDEQARVALTLVTAAAVAEAQELITPDPVASAEALAQVAPLIVAEYGGAAAELAVGYYDELRDAAPSVTSLFRAEPFVTVREKQVVGWSAGWSLDPIRKALENDLADIEAEMETARERLAEVIQLEAARAFRETVEQNTLRDDEAVGWARIVRAEGCPFCRMLADRGAVYAKETARFASHPNCNCTARAAFKGDPGPEASVMQYVASRRKRTPDQQAALKQYLHENFGGPVPKVSL